MDMAQREAAASHPNCGAGAPARGLVERLRDSSGGHINGLYDREAADEIERLTELADSEGSRAVKYLRRARTAEAEVALLRAALNGGNVIERLQFALQRLADAADGVGVKHFDTDWLSDEVQELQAATHAARLVLGPNVGIEPPYSVGSNDGLGSTSEQRGTV